MNTDSSMMTSRTIPIDDESSPDVSEFRLVRAADSSSPPLAELHATSVVVEDTSPLDSSLVHEEEEEDAPPTTSAGSPAPSTTLDAGAPPRTNEDVDTALYRSLQDELDNQSAARRSDAELALTKKFLEEEDELLFRRFLAREERQAHRWPLVPPCIQRSPWVRSVLANSAWSPCGNTDDLWRNYGVRHCDCLGGPQGYHRTGCASTATNTSSSPPHMS